jgi:hypothetical protein
VCDGLGTVRVPGLLLVVAAALLLAACGGSGHPLATVQAAAAKTSNGSVWWDLNLAGARVDGDRMTVLGRGAAVFARGVAYLAVNIPGGEAPAAGVEYILYTPTVAYLRPVPAAADRLPSGRSLIAVPLAPSVDRWLPGLVGEVEVLNPKLLLDEVATGAETASSHGVEVVDHLPLKKYTVTVDLARAHARASGALRLAIGNEQAKSRSLAVTVWINPNGRVARLRATPPGGALGTATYDLTSYPAINVYARALDMRFGTNTPPTLPDSSQTLDVRALSHPQASPLAGFGIG